MGFVIKVVAHLSCIIVQEVDRLADFGNGVTEGFTGFTHQNADQILHLAFHHYGSALQNGGALLRRRGKPDGPFADGRIQRCRNFCGRGMTHVADHVQRLRRVKHRQQFSRLQRTNNQRLRLPALTGTA